VDDGVQGVVGVVVAEHRQAGEHQRGPAPGGSGTREGEGRHGWGSGYDAARGTRAAVKASRLKALLRKSRLKALLRGLGGRGHFTPCISFWISGATRNSSTPAP